MKAQNKCHRLFDKCVLVWQAGMYGPETLRDDFHRAVFTRKAPYRLYGVVQGGQLEQFHFDTSRTNRTAPLNILRNK